MCKPVVLYYETMKTKMMYIIYMMKIWSYNVDDRNWWNWAVWTSMEDLVHCVREAVKKFCPDHEDGWVRNKLRMVNNRGNWLMISTYLQNCT